MFDFDLRAWFSQTKAVVCLRAATEKFEKWKQREDLAPQSSIPEGDYIFVLIRAYIYALALIYVLISYYYRHGGVRLRLLLRNTPNAQILDDFNP